MKDAPKDHRPPTVPATAMQGGEARAPKAWAEPAVWTERMLTALQNGVKGGKWFSLMDKVYAPANLEAAWQRVRANRGAAGVDRQSVEKFSAQAPRYLAELHEQLRTDAYRPMPVLRAWIEKPGTGKLRPLGIPTVKDRVVQAALKNVMEPIFERKFAEHSYGFRPRRGCKDALRRVDALLRAGFTWVVDADIEGFFDHIGHAVVMAEMEREVADGRVRSLVRRFLAQEVTDAETTWEPEGGTPQGAVLSPLPANICLHPVDVAMREAGHEMVRYADDLVVLCRSEAEANLALEKLRTELTKLGLTLHATKTRVRDENRFKGGFDFLGYHFERGNRWPRVRSMTTLREKIRRKTRRTNGNSLSCIIAAVNPILRGWYEYFKHACRSTFQRIDGWVRMRLRSILRKRHRGRGAGRGWSNRKWPNAYFAESGLLALLTAWTKERQSRCGNH